MSKMFGVDINIPARYVGFLYKFSYPIQPTQLYLCAENSETFKVTLLDDDISFTGNKGFNYWPIKSTQVVNVVCDKKIFNLYLCYSSELPRQFY
jgi:hypothetical protein